MGAAVDAASVLNDVVVASSVVQVMSEYVLYVWAVFAVRPVRLAVVPLCAPEQLPPLGTDRS